MTEHPTTEAEPTLADHLKARSARVDIDRRRQAENFFAKSSPDVVAELCERLARVMPKPPEHRGGPWTPLRGLGAGVLKTIERVALAWGDVMPSEAALDSWPAVRAHLESLQAEIREAVADRRVTGDPYEASRAIERALTNLRKSANSFSMRNGGGPIRRYASWGRE